MSLRIVGVHGVGNHRPGQSDALAAAALSDRWSEAIAHGLGVAPDAVYTTVAYYAPHLHHLVSQHPDDGLDNLPSDLLEMAMAWSDQLGVHQADVEQAGWSVGLRALVDRIARTRNLDAILLRPFVALFLNEVWSYLRRPDSPVRQACQKVVADAIREHRPHVVIAHSLGSVVAYETLHAFPELSADLLVTIGSPLAMSGVVFERLIPSPFDDVGFRPANIARWVNIADPGDIVAVPRPLTGRFAPDEDHQDTHIHWLDFHSARRYLQSSPMKSALLPYLTAG